jgi:hypothetical protein
MRAPKSPARQDGRVEPTDRAERKRRGAWYTPPRIVDFLVEQAVVPAMRSAAATGGAVRILDPACGDGRVLAAAARAFEHAPVAHRIGADSVDDARGRLNLVGIESDPSSAASARSNVPGARILVGDGRVLDPTGCFDAVVGNPPYLGQLTHATSRGGRSPLGGGPYADVAAEFLVRAVASARPDGGRVALVLPQSLLASRDTASIRAALLERAALVGLWWAGQPVFDAAVTVCVLVLQRGVPQGDIRRWRGPDLAPAPSAPATDVAGPTWSPLVADLAGIPPVEVDTDAGRLGDLASATAGFRHQFYGLVDHVTDGAVGPPLVTAGLIDAGACRWGALPVRFAKRTFIAPRVDLVALTRADPKLAAWVEARLRPKVLVATQTRVIEAVADPDGAWVPSTPVIAVHPERAEDVWAVAAVLTAPPVAAWAAARHVGAGLGGTALKLSAAQVLDLPLPPRPWSAGAECLRRGDMAGCAEAMCDAYGVTRPRRGPLLAWWWAGAAASRSTRAGGLLACP